MLVPQNILYLAMRGVMMIKVDWAELGGRDGTWLMLGQCSSTRLILGKQIICKEELRSNSGTVQCGHKFVIDKSINIKLSIKL